MDIARPDLAVKRRKRRIAAIAITLAVVAVITVALSRLKPAVPFVDSPVYTDTVKRGPLLCDVHGSGTLTPEEIRWITTQTAGRVERILLLPGVTVRADTVLVELNNPELIQSAFETESLLRASRAQLDRLKVQLESDRLTQESAVATLKSDRAQARLEAEADEQLLKDGLVPILTAKKSRAKADDLDARLQLEQKRLDISEKSARAQILVQEAELAKLEKLDQLKKEQVQSLRVRADIDGVLQKIGDEHPLQSGQQVAAGGNIARIANPAKLKAEIKIAETQAKDVQHGQSAMIDTRNGVIPGHVVRIDPAVQNGTVTVDVALDGPLPRGARPDLTVDGTIILEKLSDVLQVGRPVNSQADAKMGLFKLIDGGRMALRVPVQLGHSSVSSVEIISGLQSGDQIILSDMSQWDAHEKVRLK